jgi:hypothetical protein
VRDAHAVTDADRDHATEILVGHAQDDPPPWWGGGFPDESGLRCMRHHAER